jgi:hypothetical protein
MIPALHLVLPCPKCGAESGVPCRPLSSSGRPPKRPHVRRTPAAPCGTDGGYQRHVKEGSETCDDCRDAHRRAMAAFRQKHPDKRAADVAALKARREATKRLIAAHRDEFNRLLAEVAS